MTGWPAAEEPKNNNRYALSINCVQYTHPENRIMDGYLLMFVKYPESTSCSRLNHAHSLIYTTTLLIATYRTAA
jgi:hypothetical protein